MTSTPNTPAELAALAQEPNTPYNRPAVRAAMDCLIENDESNAGDFQAVAELCIDFLKNVAYSDLERHADHCCVTPVIRKAIFNIEAAEEFLQRVPIIGMNAEDEE